MLVPHSAWFLVFYFMVVGDSFDGGDAMVVHIPLSPQTRFGFLFPRGRAGLCVYPKLWFSNFFRIVSHEAKCCRH